MIRTRENLLTVNVLHTQGVAFSLNMYSRLIEENNLVRDAFKHYS